MVIISIGIMPSKKAIQGRLCLQKQPLSVKYGVGDADTEDEGRILTLEFEQFYLVNVYVPNAQRDLARLPLRLEWEENMRAYLKSLISISRSSYVVI